MDRKLYIYNPDTGEVRDTQDISDCGEAYVSALKMRMYLNCEFPWDVIDTAEPATLGLNDRIELNGEVHRPR